MSVCLFKRAPWGTQETLPNLAQPVPEVLRRKEEAAAAACLPPAASAAPGGPAQPLGAPSSDPAALQIQRGAQTLPPAPYELPPRIAHPAVAGGRAVPGPVPDKASYLSCPANLNLPAAANSGGAFVSLRRSFWEVMKSVCQHNSLLRRALERI